MTVIVTEQGLLHYEYLGRGQPVVLLHGWINSWDVWRDSMITLATTGRYRVYALDFWGFGESAKAAQATNSPYQIASYVQMVQQFMDTLGIYQAPIFGHSMGGTVALKYAIENPDRVQKVAVVGSPIVGSSLNPFLKLAGYGWIGNLVWQYPILLKAVMFSLLAGDSTRVRQMISRDVQRATVESFFRSIGDLRETDLRPKLPSLDKPVLGIYGAKDNIVSPSNAELLAHSVKLSTVSMLKRSRHFPMSDEPEEFVQSLDKFLANRVVQ